MPIKLYSKHSSYPIQSLFKISSTQFATIFPLDHILQVYSTQQSDPISNLNCHETQYIDMMINDMFITHGNWTISILSQAFAHKLQTNESIISNICKVKDRLMNVNSNGQLCVYFFNDQLKHQNSIRIPQFNYRFRDKRVPLYQLSGSQNLGLISSTNEYLNFNIQYKLIQNSIFCENLQSRIEYKNISLLCCKDKIYLHDPRINKIFRKYETKNATCLKLQNNSILFSHENKIQELDLLKGEIINQTEFSFPYRQISLFQKLDQQKIVLVTQPYCSLDVYNI